MYKFKLENSGVPIATRSTTLPNLQDTNFPQKTQTIH